MSRMSNASIAKQIQMLQEKKAENDNALFQTFIDALSNSENKKQLMSFFSECDKNVIKRAAKVTVNMMPGILGKAESAVEREHEERMNAKAKSSSKTNEGSANDSNIASSCGSVSSAPTGI